MNVIAWLLGMRRAKRDDHELAQAKQQLASMQQKVAALAHPTESMQNPHRKIG